MKKYLITTADIKRIKKCRDAQGSWTAFNALTPVEPLSREQINTMLDSAGYTEVQERCDFINGLRHCELHVLGDAP